LILFVLSVSGQGHCSKVFSTADSNLLCTSRRNRLYR